MQTNVVLAEKAIAVVKCKKCYHFAIGRGLN